MKLCLSGLKEAKRQTELKSPHVKNHQKHLFQHISGEKKTLKSSVHMYTGIFQSVAFSVQFGLLSTHKQVYLIED